MNISDRDAADQYLSVCDDLGTFLTELRCNAVLETVPTAWVALYQHLEPIHFYTQVHGTAPVTFYLTTPLPGGAPKKHPATSSSSSSASSSSSSVWKKPAQADKTCIACQGRLPPKGHTVRTCTSPAAKRIRALEAALKEKRSKMPTSRRYVSLLCFVVRAFLIGLVLSLIHI